MAKRPLRESAIGVVAVMVLASIGPQAAAQQVTFEQAVSQLKSPEAGTRLAALRMLDASGYPEAGAPIAALLKDPDDRVQRAALYTELGLFLGSRVEPRRKVGFVIEVRESQPAARAFDRADPAFPVAPVPMEAVSGMLGPVGHPDPAFRAEAIYALGFLGQIDGIPPDPSYGAVAQALAGLLVDPEPGVRAATARSAGRVFARCPSPCQVEGLDRLGDALVHTLNDPDRGVRHAAQQALGDLRWIRAVQSMTSAYEHFRDGEDALACLVTLARIAHPSSAPIFKSALSRKEDAFRAAGAEGLARIGGADAGFAADALSKAGPRDLLVVAAFAAARSGDRKAVDRLVGAADAAATRALAREYLVELGPASGGAVAAALPTATPEARAALVETLGAVGTKGDLPAIEALRADKDARVAVAAERAARRIKAREKR